MENDLVTRIEGHPQYIELKAKRTRFGWWLSLAGMIAYYGFIVLVAFDKPFLARKPEGWRDARRGELFRVPAADHDHAARCKRRVDLSR